MRLVDRTADLPVVMLTAKVGEDDYHRGFTVGADAYLSKPFDPDELLDTLSAVMSLSPERRRAVRDEEQAKASLLRQLEHRFGNGPGSVPAT
jgi:two-component system phosphate regulon response regulator PhoB